MIEKFAHIVTANSDELRDRDTRVNRRPAPSATGLRKSIIINHVTRDWRDTFELA